MILEQSLHLLVYLLASLKPIQAVIYPHILLHTFFNNSTFFFEFAYYMNDSFVIVFLVLTNCKTNILGFDNADPYPRAWLSH